MKRVVYIDISFPSKGQTFAVSDLNELSKNVDEILVINLAKPKISKEYYSLNKNIRVLKKKNYFPSYIRNLSLFLKLNFFFISLVIAEFFSMPVNGFRLIRVYPRTIRAFFEVNFYDPSIVHLFWGHTPSALGVLLKKYTNYKVTMFLGAYDLFLEMKTTKRLINLADKVVTHSNYGKKMIHEKYNYPSSKVIYRGIPRGYLNFEAPRIINFELIYAGRIIRAKCLYEIIEHLYLNNDMKSCLHIFGEGIDSSRCKSLVRENAIQEVKFHNNVSRDKLLAVMRQSKLLLFFSRKKGDVIPNVLKEAMASGCIVISNIHNDSIHELIEDKRNGFLIENIEELYPLINNLMRMSDEEISRIQRMAMETIEEKFITENTIGEYLSMWSEHTDISNGKTSI